MAGIADLAQTLRTSGRGQDDQLVHMSRRELQGLQQLAVQAGGTLTINPKTGLPEAGFLEQLLPIAITAVASYFGGPWAGAAAGAAMGAMSNKQNPMMGAVAGGVGGYGMGGLGNSLAQAGMSAAEGAAVEATMSSVAPTVGTAAAPASAELLAASMQGASPTAFGAGLEHAALTPEVLASSMQGATPSALGAVWDPSVAQQLPPTTAYSQAAVKASMMPPAIEPPSKWDNIMKGIKGIPTSSKDERSDYMKYGLMSLAPLLNMDDQSGGNKNPSGVSGTVSPFTYNQGTRNPRWGEPGQPYFLNQGYTAGTPYQVGLGIARGGSIQGNGMQGGRPRMVRGLGDGLSDSIPAQIEGGSPAALADGEFVVSSDVVSALGNGSTDAGARKLYAMMDRIRTKAHGSKKQVRKVPEKQVLPA
jgi:hypothetical protein